MKEIQSFIFGHDFFPQWFVHSEGRIGLKFEKDTHGRVVACTFLNRSGIRCKRKVGESITKEDLQQSYQSTTYEEEEVKMSSENDYILENKDNYEVLLNAKKELEAGGGKTIEIDELNEEEEA